MESKKLLSKQVSPCGVNCMICMANLRTKNKCPGCRFDDSNKPKSCSECLIKNCKTFKESNKKYCYQCEMYPCKLINHIDKRYKTNYAFSMIENLQLIKDKGIREFMKIENEKWICKKCGGIISVHRGFCTDCGEVYYQHNGTNRKPIK